jgi:hypothetical protein
MPRTKKVEFIEQPINLSDDVSVIVKWPKGKKPVIDWNGDMLTVSLGGAPAVKRVAAVVSQADESQTNGPTTDTPEMLALKAKLGNPFEKKVYTSADAFGELGMEFDDAGVMALPELSTGDPS